MAEINPALALKRKIIWCWLAISICASWLQNVAGEIASHPLSPCKLHNNISAELSAAKYKPCFLKSWGKEGFPGLSGVSAAPAASFPVGQHWGGPAALPQHGLALLSCQEQPQQWHCPGAVAGTTASLFFKYWTPQKLQRPVFFMKTTRKREKGRVLIAASLLHGYCS